MFTKKFSMIQDSKLILSYTKLCCSGNVNITFCARANWISGRNMFNSRHVSKCCCTSPDHKQRALVCKLFYPFLDGEDEDDDVVGNVSWYEKLRSFREEAKVKTIKHLTHSQVVPSAEYAETMWVWEEKVLRQSKQQSF